MLDRWKYLDLIDIYASHYSLDPDLVYLKSFRDVTVWLEKWVDDAEIRDRVTELEKAFQNANTPKPA
jgi:hypothetical protein